MKIIIYFFILFILFSTNIRAEIAYIDLNYILNTSNVGKSLNNHIKELHSKDLAKFKEIEINLIEKEKLIIAQQNILENNDFKKKLSILSSEVQKYRADKKAFTEELNKIKIEKTKEILAVLNPLITNYVDSNSISIVLPKKNIIVGKKNLDITDEIIKLLNENINLLKI